MATILIGETEKVIVDELRHQARSSWWIASLFRYQPRVSQPALWRLARRGIVRVVYDASGDSKLSLTERERLARGRAEQPRASVFWVLTDAAAAAEFKVRRSSPRSLRNLRK